MTELDEMTARELRSNRRLAVGLCVAVAFVFYFIKARGPFLSGAAYAFGATLMLSLIPALLAFIVSRSSSKWHYTFAAAFALLFALSLLGSLAR